MVREYYTINDLTDEFSITARTLRYYEDEGLISPLRKGYTRLYTQIDCNRIAAILRGRRLNFSIDEIRKLLHIQDNVLQDGQTLRYTLDHISNLRKKLEHMQKDINEQLHELERLEEHAFERLAELGVKR